MVNQNDWLDLTVTLAETQWKTVNRIQRYSQNKIQNQVHGFPNGFSKNDSEINPVIFTIIKPIRL